MIARYRFRAHRSRVLRDVIQLREKAVPALQATAQTPSRVYRLLRAFSLQSLRLLLLAEDGEAVRQAVDLYLDELRHVRTALSGDDLKSLGLAPGPLYKRILGALLDARLDGQTQTRAEEESLLKELLSVQGLSQVTGKGKMDP
jgi:tRNA nucleotidyltransferase (CCA-adding enzyme)